jgi:hypothetical protein
MTHSVRVVLDATMRNHNMYYLVNQEALFFMAGPQHFVFQKDQHFSRWKSGLRRRMNQD